MEVPAAFREFAEKSVSQAKDNWEKMKAATEEASGLIEGSYATATKGATDYGLKMIEAARANTNAAFDYAGQMMSVKSLAEAVELSTAHLRKQFDTMSTQTKELSSLAQKVATDTCEPIKEASPAPSSGVSLARLSLRSPQRRRWLESEPGLKRPRGSSLSELAVALRLAKPVLCTPRFPARRDLCRSSSSVG